MTDWAHWGKIKRERDINLLLLSSRAGPLYKADTHTHEQDDEKAVGEIKRHQEQTSRWGR